MENLDNIIKHYQNTADVNSRVHKEFTKATDSVKWLKEHRDFVEKNSYGFGDRAFHYMWFILLSSLKNKPNLKLLEIGVFKGQVISLWSLISSMLKFECTIYGIGPLEGNHSEPQNWISQLILKTKLKLFKKYEGNLYPKENYVQIIDEIFRAFNLGSNNLVLTKGYSNDKSVISKFRNEKFDLIYIDGDHSYEVVLSDIRTFAPLVCDNGFLIMDDAAYDLPGTGFHKGYLSVTKACKEIPKMGFKNILNVGHNRIFQKVE